MHDYFTDQSSFDDRNANLPEDLNIPDFSLNSISITTNEVESVLKALQTGKALVLTLSIIEFLKS